MRSMPTIFSLATSTFINSIAALGINCRGSLLCSPTRSEHPTGGLIPHFVDALTRGGSPFDVPGGPIADDTVYYLGDPKHIACRPEEAGSGICLFMQGNVPAAGINGSVLKTRIIDLYNHECLYCGSVPLSGDNNPVEMGILTSNYVSQAACIGVCGFVRPQVDTE
ncbi:hypothetical protein MMC24_006745 [Lignoscripta atroalba]|nr:hypothetical protein [Lignoscripta atroalba]